MDRHLPWTRKLIANQRAFVLDPNVRAIVQVDLATGDRTVIADDDTGTGPELLDPRQAKLVRRALAAQQR